jgi:hypothetical protein
MPTRQHLPRNAGPKRKSLTEKPKRKTNKKNSKTAQLFVEFLIGHPGRPPTWGREASPRMQAGPTTNTITSTPKNINLNLTLGLPPTWTKDSKTCQHPTKLKALLLLALSGRRGEVKLWPRRALRTCWKFNTAQLDTRQSK